MVVLKKDQKIVRLENGNYEVTPAWLKERYEYERWLLLELERCQSEH